MRVRLLVPCDPSPRQLRQLFPVVGMLQPRYHKDRMGTFRHRIELAARPEGPFISVEALVDTGATYTLVPRPIVAGLGIAPQERDQFVLADGRRVERDVASCLVRLNGRVRSTVCVIDDGAPETLLGAVTLEEFGLAVDPVNRRLVKAEKYLV